MRGVGSGLHRRARRVGKLAVRMRASACICKRFRVPVSQRRRYAGSSEMGDDPGRSAVGQRRHFRLQANRHVSGAHIDNSDKQLVGLVTPARSVCRARNNISPSSHLRSLRPTGFRRNSLRRLRASARAPIEAMIWFSRSSPIATPIMRSSVRHIAGPPRTTCQSLIISFPA